jgi:hypothetical protein
MPSTFQRKGAKKREDRKDSFQVSLWPSLPFAVFALSRVEVAPRSRRLSQALLVSDSKRHENHQC